ncbi:unnamed protein product, partial [Trichobilharzia szidati]
SQRSKLNPVMVVGLCIVNIMWIRSDIFPVTMTFDGEGKVNVQFFKINFTLNHRDLNLTVKDVDCIYWVAFGFSMTKQEWDNRAGQRKGYVDCLSWHGQRGRNYF